MDDSAMQAAKRTDVLCFSILKTSLSSIKWNPTNCLFSSNKCPLGVISLFPSQFYTCTQACSLTKKPDCHFPYLLSPPHPLFSIFCSLKLKQTQTKLPCFLKIHLWKTKIKPHYYLPLFQVQFCHNIIFGTNQISVVKDEETLKLLFGFWINIVFPYLW